MGGTSKINMIHVDKIAEELAKQWIQQAEYSDEGYMGCFCVYLTGTAYTEHLSTAGLTIYARVLLMMCPLEIN